MLAYRQSSVARAPRAVKCQKWRHDGSSSAQAVQNATGLAGALAVGCQATRRLRHSRRKRVLHCIAKAKSLGRPPEGLLGPLLLLLLCCTGIR
jgi:hypothetical protein